MKKLLKLATLLFALTAMTFVGCENPEDAWIVDGKGITAKVTSSTDSKVVLEVQTMGMSKIAWTASRTDGVAEAPKTPVPMLVFKNGAQMEVTDGKHTVEVKNLTANATYNIYIAGEIAATADLTAETFVLSDARTADFSEDITVRDVAYDGITIDIKVPASVREEDHLIKWATSDLYLFNRNKIGMRGAVPDTDLMNWNDSKEGWGHLYFDSSKSITITEMNSFDVDENGNMDTDYHYYEALVPGQPQVFILGEYEFGQSNSGWGWGYYEPLFDRSAWASALAKNGGELVDEAPYWDGMYIHKVIKTKEPEKLPDELMKVELDIRTDDAIIDVTLDESIPIVQIMVLDEEQHALAYKWLGESYEHFQWFATSYVGMMEGATDFYQRPANGRVRTALSEYLINVSMTSKYWVYVVGISGEGRDGYLDGSKQVCWNMNGFNLKETTKPAPTIEVTPLEPTEPNQARFKIHCPTAAEGNGANKAYYISEYEREWLSTGMTAQELLDEYAWGNKSFAIDAVQIDKINSEEGLIVEFMSRPNENYHFAAVIANDEGSRAYSDAVVCRTLEKAVEKVESPLYESLKGEWTASATVRYKKLRDDVDTDDESLTEDDLYEEKTATHTCTINIGDVEYPEALTESVYEIFAKHGVDRETTDAYYTEFRRSADLFNQTNSDHNRILVNGFNFAGEMLPYLSYFNYQSAYDLFTSDTYNGASNNMPIYEFGPKWYFEVMADGSLAVPFNSTSFEPMSSWSTDGAMGYTQEIHLIAYDPAGHQATGYLGSNGYLGMAETGYFPVSMSEDGNTITIQPLKYNGAKYYPNVGVFQGYTASSQTTVDATYSMATYIISDITLTRGTAATPARVSAKSGMADVPVVDEVEAINKIKTSIRPLRRSVFKENGKVEMVGPDHSLTPEQKKARWNELRHIKIK